MDIRHLKQVLSIHAQGSLAKASVALGISQPTLSKSIARLEDQLGFKLFDRSSAGAVPTPLGAFVIERAQKIIGDAARLNREIELMAAGDIGQVSLGVGASLSPVLFPAFAIAIAKRFPKLRLRMVIDRRRNLLAGIVAGELDLILLAAEQDLEPLHLHQTDLMTERVVAVASPTHPLAGRQHISTDLFAQHPGATSATSGAFTPQQVMGLSAEQADLAGFYRSNDFGTIRAIARAGMATAMGPAHLFNEDVEAGRLVRLDLDLDFSVKIIVAMTQAAAHSPTLREIVKITKAAAEKISKETRLETP